MILKSQQNRIELVTRPELVQEMPEDALDEEVEATCKICHESFTAHRYLYTHLSDTHFQPDLDKVGRRQRIHFSRRLEFIIAVLCGVFSSVFASSSAPFHALKLSV